MLPQREEIRNTLQNTANARDEPGATRDAMPAHKTSGLSRFLL
jgi:hypothetical protein